MELHPPGQLNAVPAVADVLLRYLARLPLSGERRAMMFADALGHGATVARALARVHAALAFATRRPYLLPTARHPLSTIIRRRERRAIPADAGAITRRDGVCCWCC